MKMLIQFTLRNPMVATGGGDRLNLLHEDPPLQRGVTDSKCLGCVAWPHEPQICVSHIDLHNRSPSWRKQSCCYFAGSDWTGTPNPYARNISCVSERRTNCRNS